MNNIAQSSACVTTCEKNSLNVNFDALDFPLESSLFWERGGEAPLDLIKGHLTETTYTKASRGFSFYDSPKGWHVPEGYESTPANNYVAKIQPFQSGGYEVTVSSLDIQKIGRMMDAPRSTGKREKGEQNENDVVTSIQRSKKKVRHLIKSMGCDRLLTLTRREKEQDEFWTIEQWKVAWDKFRRLCEKAGVDLQYVAVLEAHKKGNYHLHAAIVGKLSVNIIRGIWLACTGGKGSGNVDIQMKQNCTVHQRRAGLAKYVSKYITKQAELVEFNKKRYWSSRHKLPDARRYVLTADNFEAALNELLSYLGLNPLRVDGKIFVFPDENGCWFNYDESFSSPPPF
jgi:hypothetical protein